MWGRGRPVGLQPTDWIRGRMRDEFLLKRADGHVRPCPRCGRHEQEERHHPHAHELIPPTRTDLRKSPRPRFCTPRPNVGAISQVSDGSASINWTLYAGPPLGNVSAASSKSHNASVTSKNPRRAFSRSGRGHRWKDGRIRQGIQRPLHHRGSKRWRERPWLSTTYCMPLMPLT